MFIQPRLLKGFRDILPRQELIRRQIIHTIEETCHQFCFVPIDTPILEYSEILLGKGGGETDKQLYRFQDHGGRDVAMRFDLTVPFARFMSSHVNELYLPFRRYHIAKVFRGEKPQQGRYREFTQCDFDIVGVDSQAADFEILQLMSASFAAMGIENLRFHVSHRGMFNSFLKAEGIGEDAKVMRIVDKLVKIGHEECLRLLSTLIGNTAAEKILEYIRPEKNNEETLIKMESLSGNNNNDEDSEPGRLRSILTLARELNLEAQIYLDPSITRGMDYYTGIVYETFLTDVPHIGSVCSGGRYNNLASLYTATKLEGVGSSIGLDRLIAAQAELTDLGKSTTGNLLRESEVLVFMLDEAYLTWYSKIAEQFRAAGLRCEVYPSPRKLQQQFVYAEKKGIPIGIIAGEAEIERNLLNVKNLITREGQENINIDRAITLASEIIATHK